MALTVEDVNAIQDEMNKIEDPEDDASKTAATDAASKAAKLEEAKVVEDKAKVDADAEAKAKEADGKGKDKEEESVDDVRELKEQLRTNKEALSKVSADYQKLHKIMVDKGLLTEEEVNADKAKEAEVTAANAERQNKLTEMVTIMELNPTYSDVRQVCTQGNLDDVIEAFSRFYVKENGGNLSDVAAKMEGEIWSEPNPYKKMFEVIKKYHPKFAKAEDSEEVKKVKDAEDAAKKVAAEADKVKAKVAVDANPSAASIGAGGSGAGGSGWTDAKITALDEDELKTVPKDIYEKYLKGTLA